MKYNITPGHPDYCAFLDPDAYAASSVEAKIVDYSLRKSMHRFSDTPVPKGIGRTRIGQVQERFRRAEDTLARQCADIDTRLRAALTPPARRALPTYASRDRRLQAVPGRLALSRRLGHPPERADLELLARAREAHGRARSAFLAEVAQCDQDMRRVHPRWWPDIRERHGGTLELLTVLDRPLFTRSYYLSTSWHTKKERKKTGFELLAIGQTTELREQLGEVLARKKRRRPSST